MDESLHTSPQLQPLPFFAMAILHPLRTGYPTFLWSGPLDPPAVSRVVLFPASRLRNHRRSSAPVVSASRRPQNCPAPPVSQPPHEQELFHRHLRPEHASLVAPDSSEVHALCWRFLVSGTPDGAILRPLGPEAHVVQLPRDSAPKWLPRSTGLDKKFPAYPAISRHKSRKWHSGTACKPNPPLRRCGMSDTSGAPHPRMGPLSPCR